jgi:hypothetical protein
MSSVCPPMMISVKQFLVREIFFCIWMVAPEKSLGTTALDDGLHSFLREEVTLRNHGDSPG